jgi:hypothetical protein
MGYVEIIVRGGVAQVVKITGEVIVKLIDYDGDEAERHVFKADEKGNIYEV